MSTGGYQADAQVVDISHPCETEETGEAESESSSPEQTPTEGDEAGEATTVSPQMEEATQLAQDLRPVSNVASGDDQAKDVYHVKWTKFKGRKVPIVMQNVNGPCPLLAIANVLFLKEKVVLEQSTEVVTSSQLMGYLVDIALQAMPKNIPEEEQPNWLRNVDDAMTIFPKLQTGLDVNVRFTGVKEFEYTQECVVFDLLRVPLFHGWLVDNATPDIVAAVGNLTYNQLVEKVIENRNSTDQENSTQAVLGQMFLDESASQLTYHGLAELSSTLNEDQMAVFFRNNHFSTIYKHQGHLFLLVTDQGYLRQSKIVWEALTNVEGDGELVDADFKIPQNLEPIASSPVPANTQEQVDQDLLLALSLNNQDEQAQLRTASPQETDEDFAKRLQEEENRQAAAQQQQAAAQQQQAERAANVPQDLYAQQRREHQQRREYDDDDEYPQRHRRRSSGRCVLL